MKTESLKMNKERIILFFVLLVIFLWYASQLTRCGLWYDEAIEYFYSKYVGALPEIMSGNSGGANMYERICSTFQPPLYNVLMHFWLLLFDSEVSFRLAGVLVTFVGAIGFYKSVKVISNSVWATCSIVVYLMTRSVMYYALECAEYNLMLCMESWALYYFVKFLNGTDFKQRRNSFYGFLAFAVLAAYSQYGAILLVVPLCVVMFIDTAKKGDKRLLTVMIASVAVVMVFFAAPLIYFFLIPQMEHQNSIGVSHYPVFRKNIFYSVPYGVFCLIQFIFGSPLLFAPLTIFVGLFSFLGLRNHNKLLTTFWITLVAVYLLYFILVACSFYGYNGWNVSFGCYNLGGRYTLYIAPPMLITLIYGLFNYREYLLRKGKWHNTVRYLLWGIMLIYVGAGMWTYLTKGLDKSNEREAYRLWEASGLSKNITIVHNFSNPIFAYYFMHSEHYNAETSKNVIGEGMWGRKATPDERYHKLDSMGVYEHDDVVVVTPHEFWGPVDYDIAMEKAGYSPEYLLDGRKDGWVNLIVYSK